MAVTVKATADVAKVLDAILDEIAGLRTYWYVADTVRPPAVIVGQPDIDYADASSGFCFARWEFPLTVIVSRNADRAAQEALSRRTNEIAAALNAAESDDVFSIEPLDARPTTANVAGQDLPAYLMRVAVRA
jgi:hypothetical protein